MNTLVTQYFRAGPDFEQVLFLHEKLDLKWDQVVQKTLEIPKGWFELSRISPNDRVLFTHDFWCNRLPFHAKRSKELTGFFEKLDDVGVVLYLNQGIWTAELVYSLEDNSSFFRGAVPASAADVNELISSLDRSLPQDYLSFVKIHNGFGRLSEMGLLKVDELTESKRWLTQKIIQNERILKSGAVSVDPSALYPFYEVYGLASFQCFYADWYPTSEMGNVYFSAIDFTLSDLSEERNWADQLAFPTFLDWLIDYLYPSERI